MRRIEIPPLAIARHEALLGGVLLKFLRRLANGQRISWSVKERGGGKKIRKRHNERERILGLIGNDRCVKYWKWVYAQFKDKHILTAKPAILVAFALENAKRFNDLRSTSGRGHSKEQSAVLEVIGRLFAYASFREEMILLSPESNNNRIQWFRPSDSTARRKTKKTKCRESEFASWGGWSISGFVRLLDVRYCPYCNAETVGTAHSLNGGFVSDIDHIFPKGVYPLLSLSLYNLVPVCNRCNSRFKKEYDMLAGWNGVGDIPSLHPYVHHICKHIRFDYNPIGVGNLYLKPHSVDPKYVSPLNVSVVEVSAAKRQRGEDYISRYHLDEIYSDLYSEEINEAIRMEALCSSKFVESMKELYGVEEDDFDRLFRRTSLDPREINHYRFAKLIGDLHDTICFDVSDEKKNHIIEVLKRRFGLV